MTGQWNTGEGQGQTEADAPVGTGTLQPDGTMVSVFGRRHGLGYWTPSLAPESAAPHTEQWGQTEREADPVG